MRKILRILALLALVLVIVGLGLIARPAAYGQTLSPFDLIICQPGSPAFDLARQEARGGPASAQGMFAEFQKKSLCTTMDELALDKEFIVGKIAVEKFELLILVYKTKLMDEDWYAIKVITFCMRSKCATRAV